MKGEQGKPREGGEQPIVSVHKLKKPLEEKGRKGKKVRKRRVSAVVGGELKGVRDTSQTQSLWLTYGNHMNEGRSQSEKRVVFDREFLWKMEREISLMSLDRYRDAKP